MGGGMSTYLTVPEVAQMFQICEQTVRNRVNGGQWPAWRDGRQMRFGPEEIEAIRRKGSQGPAPDKAQRRTRNRQLRETRIFAQ